LGLKLIVHINQDGVRRAASILSIMARPCIPTSPKRKASNRRSTSTGSMSFSAARAATRKNPARKNAFFLSAPPRTDGTRKTRGRNFGILRTPIKGGGKAFAFFRCRIGPSLMSGNTFTARIFPSFRSISPENARSSRATARSLWSTTTGCDSSPARKYGKPKFDSGRSDVIRSAAPLNPPQKPLSRFCANCSDRTPRSARED
jgi:hypothetical protein